jgi:hypothetical protein
MKKSISLHVLAIFFIGSIMSACSSMNALTIRVKEPAPVFVHPDIQSVGIIDRSVPSEDNSKLDQLDKILSAEGMNLDKEGAERAVASLYDELSVSGRFLEVKTITDDGIKNPGLGVFPAALSWETISRLCIENDVDVIFALSFYDTDTKVDYQAVPVNIAGPLGVNIPAIEHRAQTITLINAGWRIYDPGSQYILDEFKTMERVEMTGVGINPVNAVKAITIGRKENILHASNIMGQQYATRMLPYYTRVNREYYVKGTDNFKIAMRRARTGDWDGAAELWNREVTNPKSKIAGRAYYNMAIISEINGDLDAAVNWASKSYSDYNIKEGLGYVKTLKRRIVRNQQLEAQMTQNK